MKKIILKKVILSFVLVSMITPLFIACQNPTAPNTTVPETKVELPEEYRKLIGGKWENTNQNDMKTQVEFTETHIIDYWNDRDPDYIVLDIPKVKINGNRIESNYEPIEVLESNKIKLLRSERILIRKSDTSSEGGTTPEGGSIDATKFYGSWTYTSTDNKEKNGTLTFNNDGSFSYNGEAQTGVNCTGRTYTLNGNTLTMKYDLSGQNIEESLVLSLDTNSITLTTKDDYSNVFNCFFYVNSINQKTITLNKAQ